MKNFIGFCMMALPSMLLITSCKKDVKNLDLTVTPVRNLTAPADQSDIILQPATGASITFQWSAASTPDSGVILYEIAFDKPDGDFSHRLQNSF